MTYGNAAPLGLLGPGDGDLRRGIDIFSAITPGDRLRANETFQEVLGGGSTGGSEFMGLGTDGSTFPMTVFTAARLERGAVRGVRGSIMDVRRLKQVEAEVRQLNADLEVRVEQRTRELVEATGELEAFTYSLSHDLRTPLRAIDGYSAILAETAGARLEGKEYRYLDEVRRTVKQMDGLIAGLLTLSRLGRQELVLERTSPTSVVMEVVPVVLEQAPERKVSITAGELPRAARTVPCSGRYSQT